MGKQLGVIQFRGKLGELVGAKASAGQRANVVRAKAQSVSNPKTLAQRSQRVKMTPAVNFYRALAHILDHSWQGVKYGGPSHNFFMKQALNMLNGFPYVPKGTIAPIPGRYLVSRGSLPTVTSAFSLVQQEAITTALGGGDDFATIGDLTKMLMADNAALQDGDQLTFIFALADDSDVLGEGTNYIYQTSRLVLNADSTASLDDWAASQKLSYSREGDSGRLLKIAPTSIVAQSYFINGFAVIVSRPPRTVGGAWQRSSERMAIAPLFADEIFSEDFAQAALESYGEIASTNTTSDWYLNQGNEGNNTGGTTTAGRSLTTATFNGLGSCLYMTTNGVSRLVVSEEETVSNVVGRYVYQQTAADTYRADQNTFVASNNLPANYVKASTARNYFPNVTIEDYLAQGGGGGSVEEQP